MVLMTPEDICDFIEAIQLTDGTKLLATRSKCSMPFFSEMYVEAPLGKKYGTVDILCANDEMCLLCEVKPRGYRFIKDRLDPQIGRYAEAIADTRTNFRSELVKEVRGLMSDRKVYLISVTDDDKPPSDLIDCLNIASSRGSCSVGWAPYSIFRLILERHRFKFKGRSAHIWAKHSREGSS
jgi:hypothetical protein